MAIKVVDLKEMSAAEEVTHPSGILRKVLINGPRFHAWMHVYGEPGVHDEMHCHNADQTFYCVDGECTMYFVDGSKNVLKPGMAALIPGGSWYWLENTGTGKMVLMGCRALSDEASLKIDYETRKNIGGEKGEPPKATRVLV